MEPSYRQLVTSSSVKYQILSPYTAFICKIKEVAAAKVDEPTLMKIKNFMEGPSALSGCGQ